MPYIDHDDEETKKRKKRENEELSARVYAQNREYFRGRDSQMRNDGLSDEERFRRNRERDERQRQELMRKHGWGVHLHVDQNGKYYHYIIDADGKRKNTDDRGNIISGGDVSGEQIIVLLALFFVLIPIAIGVIASSSHQFSTLQAMLIVWLSATFLAGGIIYFFTRNSDWSSRFGTIAIRVGAVIGFAVLITLGWYIG